MGNLGQELEEMMVEVIKPWEARNKTIETTMRIMKDFETENRALISRVNEDIINACEQTLYYVAIDYMTAELSRYLVYKGYATSEYRTSSRQTISWSNAESEESDNNDD